jgi:vacuolar protein sorting-associated protein 72
MYYTLRERRETPTTLSLSLFSKSIMAAARRLEKALHEATAAQSVKLVARSTRGKRMGELMGEEAEADEAFWGQDAWNVMEDSDYSSEEEEKDVFDKDFNDSESDEDGDDDVNEKEVKRKELADKRKAASAASVYKEPKKISSIARKRPRPAGDAASAKPPRAKHAGLAETPETISRAVRQSTKVKTEASTNAREDECKAALSRPAPKRQVSKPHYTQEQLLLEAAKTEIKSSAWLEEQRRRAEANKDKEERDRQVMTSFQQRYLSRSGLGTLIVFTEVDNMPQVLRQGRPPRRKARHRCAVTGLPAKYMDPLTGLPYATVDAFKEIRRRSEQEGGSESAFLVGGDEGYRSH